jgi:glycosyltransferase involved in cell wall biosynthesis
MRIGIDARLPYYQMGGISQYILYLLPALAELDQENEYVIFHSRKDGRSYQPPAANFQRHNLWTPCHHRLERWALSAELPPHRLDLLHSPDFIPPAAGAKRRVITVHDLNFFYYPQFLTAESRRYYLGQIEWAVQAADHILADSHHTRQDLMERLHVPADKVKTVHLAANPVYAQARLAEQVEQLLARHNLPRGYLLFVGTLEPRKNVPGLIKAYYQLRQETAVDVPLVLAGRKGWLYDEIFATIDELELRPYVHHLENLPDEEVACLYAAAGLLALPSHYEGFGLPVLEAMHNGCPVICSNRGSLPEVAGTAGLLLEPDDTDGWVAAVQRVLGDSELRYEMIEKGYRQAQGFTWQKTAEATLAIYRGSHE